MKVKRKIDDLSTKLSEINLTDDDSDSTYSDVSGDAILMDEPSLLNFDDVQLEQSLERVRSLPPEKRCKRSATKLESKKVTEF